MRRICCTIWLLWLVASCLNPENRADRRLPAVFADYRIWGEEGKQDVTCLFRFFEGSPDGETIVLQEGSIVLDGTTLAAGSAPETGAYYEYFRPLTEFSGTHTITFRDERGKTYREDFEYRPFTIEPEIASIQLRGPITIGINGVRPGDQLRVIVTDTSFATPDINELMPVVDGKLTISPVQLDRVSSGPLNLHLFKEEERLLRNAPPAGGTIAISYGLQRFFELSDP